MDGDTYKGMFILAGAMMMESVWSVHSSRDSMSPDTPGRKHTMIKISTHIQKLSIRKGFSPRMERSTRRTGIPRPEPLAADKGELSAGPYGCAVLNINDSGLVLGGTVLRNLHLVIADTLPPR